jgi:HEAT repeat protein
MIKANWKKWWAINKWRFIGTRRRYGVTTGAEENIDHILSTFLKGQLGHKYFDVRSAAAIALGKARALHAASKLRELSKDPNPVVAESAILALGMMRDTRSVPFLVDLLIDSRKPQRFRVNAAVSLGLVGDRAVARRLEDVALRPRDDDEVKAASLLALAVIGDERAGSVFMAQIGAARVKRHVKAMAASALGKLGQPNVRYGKRSVSVIRFLLNILQNRRREDNLRRSAALALAALGPDSEFDPKLLIRTLSLSLNDKDEDVRSFALMAVAEIARSGKALDPAHAVIRHVLAREKNHTIRGFACLAAGLARDRQSAETLRRLLVKAPSPDIRAAAAVGLGLLGDVESTPALLDILAGKGDTMLKGYCCTALGVMGATDNKEAFPVLKKLVADEADPELRAAAAVALSRLGVEGALRILLDTLKDRNQYFRMSAVMSLGYCRDLRAVKPLIMLYNSDEVNNEVRAIICVALGNIAEPTTTPVLRTLSRHYNFLLIRFRVIHQIMNLL